MRIGLFIPCYIDAFFPEVGIATLGLSECRSLVQTRAMQKRIAGGVFRGCSRHHRPPMGALLDTAGPHPRSAIIRLVLEIARAGLSPFGQVLVQFMMVWQR